MTELTRFAMDMNGYIEPFEYGPWARYEDVQELLKELEEKTKALKEIAAYKRVTSEGDHFCCAEDELSHKEEIAEAVLQTYNNI